MPFFFRPVDKNYLLEPVDERYAHFRVGERIEHLLDSADSTSAPLPCLSKMVEGGAAGGCFERSSKMASGIRQGGKWHGVA